MAKILNVNEMLIAAGESNMPGFDQFAAQLARIAKDLGDQLADHLGIEGPVNGCDVMAEEGGGAMGGFAPLHAGQGIPEVLEKFDPEGDWEPRQARQERERLAG
jgi:hypothetical protein